MLEKKIGFPALRHLFAVGSLTCLLLLHKMILLSHWTYYYCQAGPSSSQCLIIPKVHKLVWLHSLPGLAYLVRFNHPPAAGGWNFTDGEFHGQDSPQWSSLTYVHASCWVWIALGIQGGICSTGVLKKTWGGSLYTEGAHGTNIRTKNGWIKWGLKVMAFQGALGLHCPTGNMFYVFLHQN